MAMDALIATIDRRLPTAPQVYGALRDAIVKLKIGVGQALSENEVAVRLGVSRTPVREAFIRLAATGLIEVQPQRGTYVVKISPRAVRDAQFIRVCLEVGIVREACLKPVPGLVEALRVIIGRQREAADAVDFDTFLNHDEAFHRTMAEAVGRARSWRVIENEKAHMDRVRYLSLPGASPMMHLVSQHEAIVESLARTDFAACEADVRTHLSEILFVLERFQHEMPELFETENGA